MVVAVNIKWQILSYFRSVRKIAKSDY